MTGIVYHAIDMDGWLSADLVRHHLKENGIDDIKLVGYNHGNDSDKVDAVLQKVTGDIYIVDCTLPKFLMKKYADRIIWLDHHASNIRDMQDISHTFKVNASQVEDDFPWGYGQIAACELVWRFLHPTTHYSETPLVVSLAGRYDVWDKVHVPGVDEFNAYVRYMSSFPDTKYYTPFLSKWFQDLYDEHLLRTQVLPKGKELLEYQRNSWANMAKRMVSIHQHDWYQIALANVSCVNSTFFDSILPGNSDVMILVTYTFDLRHRQLRTSWYTRPNNRDIHALEVMNEILAYFPAMDVISSGGHLNACGFVAKMHTTSLFFKLVAGIPSC